MIDHSDMLELLELRMRNFLSYGNNDTIIDLTTPGTTLIVGEDLDSGTGSANGVGKASWVNAMIKTPDGWIRMGDVKVGTIIQAPDGSTVPVLGVFPQGEVDLYRVTFADGRSTVVSGDHLWQVHSHRWAGYNKAKGTKIITTLDMLPLLDHAARKNKAWYNITVPTVVHPDIDGTELPVNPYLLGALIGDGHLCGNSIMFTSADESMIKLLDEILGASHNQHLVQYGSHNNGYDWFIKNCDDIHGTHNPNSIRRKLTELGLYGSVSNTKFIPALYKDGTTKSEKLELLAGLLDTDGTVGKTKNVSYCSVSKQLALDVQYIVRSLGGKATISTRNTSFTNSQGDTVKGQLAYNVSIQLPNPRDLFKLSRKQCRLSVGPTQYANAGLRVVSVEAFGRGEAQCIYVDHPDHLYITDDFIVTHNTTILNGIVYGLYDKPLSKEIKLDHLINNINKKNMEVHLTFRKHGDTYVVSRYRKGKDGNTVVLTKNGTAVTRDSVDQTNQYIESIIGYSYDLFVRIVVFSAGHDAFLDLPTSGAKKPTQGDIMEELFDLTSLTERAERAKKEIKAAEQRMEVLKAQIEQIEREKERHDALVANTKNLITEWDDTQLRKIERLKAELATLEGIDFEKEQRLHKELKALEPARKQLRDLKDRASTWEGSHQIKLLKVLKDLKKLEGIDFDAELAHHEKLTHATARSKQITTIYGRFQDATKTRTTKIDRFTADLAKLGDIDFDREKALHTQLAEKQAELKTLNTELEDIVRIKGENLVTYEKLSTESKHLFDATCPYCLQNFAGAKEKGEKIGEQLAELGGGLKKHDGAITKKNKAISALAEEINELKGQIAVKSVAELTKMLAEKESLTQRLAEVQAEENPYQADLEQLMQASGDSLDALVQADLDDLAAQIKKYKALITVDDVDELKQMKADRVTLAQRLDDLTGEENPYREDLEDALGFEIGPDVEIDEACAPVLERMAADIKAIDAQITVDDIEELLETKNNSSTMEIRIKELSVEKNPYVKALADLEAVDLDQAQYDVINEITKVVEHHKFLVKLLTKSDSFVRKKLIEENIPFLNKQLRENLKDLGLPHKVEFTNTMSASISQLGRPLEFGNLSRGQKARVNLALAWAFHDVLQSMHGPVNFCLLDEVLDVGLCSVGVVMAAKMLKNRARRDKLTMFIISHKQEVDSIFDRTMKIQLHKGFSKIAAA